MYFKRRVCVCVPLGVCDLSKEHQSVGAVAKHSFSTPNSRANVCLCRGKWKCVDGLLALK